MRPDLDRPRRALVLGGTGFIGSAVLRELATRGVPATFTYHQSDDRAAMLASEFGHIGAQVDLADATATRLMLEGLDETPDVLIHCAAVSPTMAATDVSLATLRRTLAVNAEAPLLATSWLAGQGDRVHGADVVFVGALDGSQSLPLPVHFAASQGMLTAMTMALGHELGPRNIRVNMIALGVTGGGLSSELATEQRRDYERFSSLRRVGTATEAARAIAWLALENSYIQGRVLPINGGI